MIPIPAIDLREGQVVRLFRGDFNEEKVYLDKPEAAAKKFEQAGAKRLHVVDLDGALKGSPKNLGSIEKIINTVKMPVQIGGGIRDLKTAENYFEMGAKWVILGTMACLDKGFAKEALSEYKDRVIISIDALNGLVATYGWTNVTNIKAVDLAKKMQTLGAKTIIYTDISKDGALKGPNIEEISNLSQAVTLDVIASGGIGELEDLGEISAIGRKNIIGVIIGKALYEKKFTMKEAVEKCSRKG